MAAQIDAVAEFQKTFQLLFQKRNWMVAVPPVIGGAIALVIIGVGFAVAFGSLFAGAGLAGAMAGGGEGRGGGIAAMLFSGVGLVFLVALVIGVIVGAFALVWTYAAAEPVWSGGDPDIGGGFSKAMARLSAVAVLGLIFAVMACLGWTIIVPIAAAIFFLGWGLYIVPLIVKENQSAIDAIKGSIKLSNEQRNPSWMLLLGLIIIGFASGVVNAILGVIPFLGWIVGLCVSALAQGLSALAVWRFYNLVTGAATPTAPAVASAPPPPSAPTT